MLSLPLHLPLLVSHLSELLAELQGRLPIRVTLKGLTEDDLFRVLTEPVNNLIQQQVSSFFTIPFHPSLTRLSPFPSPYMCRGI